MSFFQGLPFAQVREDSQVELLVAGQAEVQHGLIIASAGCTAFALAGLGGRWTALDSNPVQLDLCRRKAVILQNGNREQILPLLRSGRVDRMLDRLAWCYRYGLFRQHQVREFFALADVESQREHFGRYWDGWLWRACFHLAIGQPLLWSRWFFGRLTHSFPPDFATHLRWEVEAALTRSPARSNPYLWQLFLARYPPEIWPDYLQDLERTRAGLANLHWVQGDLTAWLEEQPPQSLDFFGLSNVLELAPPEEVERLSRAVSRAGRPGALVVLRRILPRSYRDQVGPELKFSAELSMQALALERGCFCRTIEVYQVS